MTLYRRRVEYDMLQDQPSQSLIDNQLLVILGEMRVDHPQFGETMAMGHLRARGYDVTIGSDCVTLCMQQTPLTLPYHPTLRIRPRMGVACETKLI